MGSVINYFRYSFTTRSNASGPYLEASLTSTGGGYHRHRMSIIGLRSR